MSPAHNDKLRAARESTPSQWFPGRAMTRSELADRVVRHLWDRHGVESPFDRKYLAKLETGRVRYPTAPYREALRAVLGVDSDEELGFMSANRERAATALVARREPRRRRPRFVGDDRTPATIEAADRLRRLRDLVGTDDDGHPVMRELGAPIVARWLAAVDPYLLRRALGDDEDEYDDEPVPSPTPAEQGYPEGWLEERMVEIVVDFRDLPVATGLPTAMPSTPPPPPPPR